MRRRMNSDHVYIILAAFVSLQGCNITSNSVIPAGKNLFGTWNWQKTTSRQSVIPPITPGTAGYTKKYQGKIHNSLLPGKRDYSRYHSGHISGRKGAHAESTADNIATQFVMATAKWQVADDLPPGNSNWR